jgi:hypothetical protein
MLFQLLRETDWPRTGADVPPSGQNLPGGPVIFHAWQRR